LARFLYSNEKVFALKPWQAFTRHFGPQTPYAEPNQSAKKNLGKTLANAKTSKVGA